MNDNDIAFLIFLVIATGFSWYAGKKEGISVTLDYMKEQGHIDFKD